MNAQRLVTTPKVLALAQRAGVSVPITSEVDRILRGEKTPMESARALLGRAQADEL